MTLLELANFICTKVNQTEAEDVAACKEYLKRRHDLVWNEALWKDSLVEFRQTLDPDSANYTPSSNYLPGKGVLLLPPIINQVLGVRVAERKLNAQRAEYFYRIDYDAFNRTGTPAEFLLLPPCVWELDTSRNLYALRGDVADAGGSVTADLLDSDGVGVTRTNKVLDEAEKLLGNAERIDAALKTATSGAVTLATRLADGPNLVSGNYTDVLGYPLVTVPLEIGATYFYTAGTEDYCSTLLPPLGTPINPGQFVATSAQVLLVKVGATGAAADASIVRRYPLENFAVALAAETSFKRRQRIRLVEIPGQETTIRVLGKRATPPFSNDADEPAINGMENLLIAFGMADMLQRERQYGKARDLFTEAQALLQQLKEIETAQQVHHSRIIPEDGFGDEYFGGRRGFHF